jgi:hypothetical protein
MFVPLVTVRDSRKARWGRRVVLQSEIASTVPQISTTMTTPTGARPPLSSPPRYVTASGTTRTSTPFSPTRVVWECVGIVDAFVRTLLVEGYAETYVASGSRGGATTTTTINGRVPGRREGGGGARVSGFANVRTIDHSAPATGG